MQNRVQILKGFRVCRVLETFLHTLRAYQHQKVHFQHKIKNINILTCFSSDLDIDFDLKMSAIYSKRSLSWQCMEPAKAKGMGLTVNSTHFEIEIDA